MHYFYLIIFILLINRINCQSLNKYEVILDNFIVPKNNLIDIKNVRVTNYNRTIKIVIGSVNLLKPYSDSMSAIVHVFFQSGNEYRRIGMKEIKKLCTVYKNEIYYVPKYIKQTTLPYPIECPVPPVI